MFNTQIVHLNTFYLINYGSNIFLVHGRSNVPEKSTVSKKFRHGRMIASFKHVGLAYALKDYNVYVYLGRAKRICYLSPMRAAKVQASLRIRAVSPEPSLLAHTSSESRGTFRQKARSLAPLNGWACAVEICHDGMLEDTNSLDGAHLFCLY